MLRLSRLAPVYFLAVCACGANSDVGETPGPDEVARDAFNTQLAALAVPQPEGQEGQEDDVPLGEPPPTEGQPAPAGFVCTRQKFQASAVYSDNINLNPTSDVLFLGAVLDGGSIDTGEYIPLRAERGEMKFSLSHDAIAGTGTVTNSSLSSFREEFKRIIAAKGDGATTANLSYEVRQVHSKEHLMLALGGGAAAVGSAPALGAIAGAFKFEENTLSSRVLVKFNQVYFSADMDIPTNPADHFAPSVTYEDVKSDITRDYSPVYVSSVRYGRLVLFSVVSQEKESDVKAALGAVFATLTGGAAGGVSAHYENVINNSTITAQIYGGSAGEASKSITGLAKLQEFISEGGNFSADSPGYPLAYTLRYVANNAVVKVKQTTDYIVRNCVQKAYKYRVRLGNLTVTSLDGEEGDRAELYGEAFVSAAYYDANGVQTGTSFAETALWSVPNPGNLGANTIDLKAGESQSLGGARNFEFDPVLADTACFKVRGHLWDFDLDLFDDDDNLGPQSKLVCVNTDSAQWTSGDGHFDITGFASGNTKATLRFFVEVIAP